MPKDVPERKMPSADSRSADKLKGASPQSDGVLQKPEIKIRWVKNAIDGKLYRARVAPDEAMVDAHATPQSLPREPDLPVRQTTDPTIAEDR